MQHCRNGRPVSRGKAIAIAAVVLCIIAAILFLFQDALWGGGMELALLDADTGECHASFPVEEGSTFSVTFLHSVNKSDVCETYCVEGGSIYVESCEYSAFGAGVATQVEPGQTLTHTPDGHMLLSGIHREIPSLSYIVGTIYDHYLDIDGQTINLTELCGKNSTVCFTLVS